MTKSGASRTFNHCRHKCGTSWGISNFIQFKNAASVVNGAHAPGTRWRWTTVIRNCSSHRLLAWSTKEKEKFFGMPWRVIQKRFKRVGGEFKKLRSNTWKKWKKRSTWKKWNRIRVSGCSYGEAPAMICAWATLNGNIRVVNNQVSWLPSHLECSAEKKTDNEKMNLRVRFSQKLRKQLNCYQHTKQTREKI